jgi:hypothetical protein
VRLHRAADLERAELARVVLAYLMVLAGNMRQARRMLDWFDVDRTIAALRLEQLDALATAVEPILHRTAERGLAVALAAPPAADATLTVQLTDNTPFRATLVEFARRQAGALVRDVSTETRRAIRRIIEQAVHAGRRPADTASLLEDIVGLTNRQAQAVRRFRDAHLEAGTSPATMDRLVSRYADRLLRFRARMIARTETIRAANEGRRSQWRRNVDEGTILPDRWEREWVAIVPSDGRTCRYCVGQDGQRAPIDGSYPNGSSGPPGHPDCRCTEKLVRAGEAPVA